MKALMAHSLILTASFFALPAFAALPASAAPTSPRPWLEAKVEQGRKLATQKIEAGSPQEKTWNDDATRLIHELLDWNELTQRSLGTQWKKLSPEEQKSFSALLQEMIEASYQSKLRMATRGQVKKPNQVQVQWTDEKIEGDTAKASAKVKSDKRKVALDFSLKWDGNKWRVFDLSIDEVGTVATYRSQFRKIIEKEGVGGLMDRMRAKIADIREGRAEFGVD